MVMAPREGRRDCSSLSLYRMPAPPWRIWAPSVPSVIGVVAPEDRDHLLVATRLVLDAVQELEHAKAEAAGQHERNHQYYRSLCPSKLLDRVNAGQRPTSGTALAVSQS